MNEVRELAVALKEWSVAIRALIEGRQILLIRKGGLLDVEGVFEPEYSRFWLLPTKWHQDANLLKSEHHDLLRNDAPPEKGVIHLQAWAEVAKVWSLDAGDEATEEKLGRLPHIWSTRYLDVRLGYQPQKPIQVLALRIHVLDTTHIVETRPEYSGCRSWVELDPGLETQPSRAVWNENEFAWELGKVSDVLK